MPEGAFTCASCDEVSSVALRCRFVPAWEPAVCRCCCGCPAPDHRVVGFIWFAWKGLCTPPCPGTGQAQGDDGCPDPGF